MAGNSSATSNKNIRDPSEETKKHNSNNVGWEYGELINVNDKLK